jgi:hypothetical protein
MNTLRQPVEIPENRHLRLDLVLPGHLPVGKMEMPLVFTPMNSRNDVEHLPESAELSDADAVGLQHAWRGECDEPWDAAAGGNL